MSKVKTKYSFKDIAWRDLLLLPILIVAMFGLMFISGLLFSMYKSEMNQLEMALLSTLSQIVAYIIVIVVFYLLHFKTMTVRFKKGIAYIKKHWLFIGILYIVSMILMSGYGYATQWLPKHLQFDETQNELEINQLFNVTWFLPFTFLLIVILAPVIEEIFFRHILIGELGKKFNFIVMSIISLILFAAMHVTEAKSPFELGPYLILACALVFIYLKSGRNLGASIAFHILNNLISFIISIITLR
ncbi:CPBP family intramembrane metalloprotease [Staphylococcus simiae]|uniref:CPBP family intramembrane glutamic endopeptidase n=1 Tax=Staphylococcus simiae TaxID=308354 RepID=UPI001A971387|nr:CPBP family intramembrane glutamic endopeptidase [Staphylococcus simiae]MBO1199966.1 CPBP family intramembrane metalloprotease [Staphylococcus simiae]MBO1201962.1 CPBP family intramembrane metalloprotease [Staphylococcus simiae]MBO1204159.1 CPBP family intramembrane metalloprotease [Staphylococcus simiae]MBO1212038.1 CPBP family intramembrane metalloprotease [Staphylococcus simiae]MBO1230411.1 CPBP family intramembrane metalloprotease [Staphylococcus simiae]